MLANQGAYQLLACSYSPGKGCSSAAGHSLGGCLASKPPCSPVARCVGARPTLISRPCAGARPAQCLRWGTGELHASSPTSAATSSSATMSLHSSKQQGDIALESVCFKCFRCFKGVLQVFHIDVAKVDRDIAHVAMAIHVYFKCRFQMFQLFQTYVAYICKCFKCFHTYVASIFIWMFAMVTHVASSFF